MARTMRQSRSAQLVKAPWCGCCGTLTVTNQGEPNSSGYSPCMIDELQADGICAVAQIGTCGRQAGPTVTLRSDRLDATLVLDPKSLRMRLNVRVDSERFEYIFRHGVMVEHEDGK